MNNPSMNNPMSNAAIPLDNAPQQKKKKTPKPKATNGSASATGTKRGRKKKVGDDKKCNKKKFGKKGVTVTSQAREIVYNVIKHFKKEAQQKCNSHPFENWLKRSVAATGLSKSTLQRIIKEVEKPVVKTPPPQESILHQALKQEQSSPSQQQHTVPPPEILVSQTLEAVRLEQYEQGLIKHFTSNFMHHNLHHHHPMTPHHHDLVLQPLHHAPMPPPPQPPPPPPIHSHPHTPHTHIHS